MRLEHYIWWQKQYIELTWRYSKYLHMYCYFWLINLPQIISVYNILYFRSHTLSQEKKLCLFFCDCQKKKLCFLFHGAQIQETQQKRYRSIHSYKYKSITVNKYCCLIMTLIQTKTWTCFSLIYSYYMSCHPKCENKNTQGLLLSAFIICRKGNGTWSTVHATSYTIGKSIDEAGSLATH